MSFLPLAIPPGVVRSGTEYRSKGRWYDTNLVRWYEGGELGPILGWRTYSTGAMTGKPRAIITLRDDSSNRRVVIGTHSKLYTMNSAGTLNDITPAGFTAGRADAVSSLGYGFNTYGSGAWGTKRHDTGSALDATVWDLDLWGQYAVGCSPEDGKLYMWQLNPAVAAAQIAGSPISCKGLVVTPERFIFALGAGGNNRKVQWCDQEAETIWTPSATNQAGDLDLPIGRCITGRVVGNETLIWTDLGVHAFTYVGLPFVYSQRVVGWGCGAMSKRCMAVIGPQVVWWSTSGFWIYDGAARPLPCDVWDDLLRNLTSAQRSKVSAFHNSKNGEVWWLFPRDGATENNAYVFWNYRGNYWGMGDMVRLCGSDPGVFVYPLLAGSDGYVYEHENGYSYGGDSPSARSGPIELGNGDTVMHALAVVPDEKTAGDVTVSFRTRPYPDAAETVLTTTTFDATGKADVRFSARQLELVVTGDAQTNWRWGAPRLEVRAGGAR